jgi:hypothetical protein
VKFDELGIAIKDKGSFTVKGGKAKEPSHEKFTLASGLGTPLSELGQRARG